MEDIRKKKLYYNIASKKIEATQKLTIKASTNHNKYLQRQKLRIENELLKINSEIQEYQEELEESKQILEILKSKNENEIEKLILLLSYIDEIEMPIHLLKKLRNRKNYLFFSRISTLYSLLKFQEDSKELIDAMGEELHRELIEYFKSKGYSFGYKIQYNG